MKGPAAWVAGLALALPVIFGASVLDALLYTCYEVVWVGVPGVLAYRVLSPRPGSPLRHVAIGWALGYVLEILAFIATAAVGARGLFYTYPAIVAAVAVPVLLRRSRAGGGSGHEAGGPARTRWAWPFAGVIALTLIYLGLAHFTLAPLPSPDRTVLYHPDHAFHVSIAAEAKHHWPILDSQIAHEPRVYHVFAHIHVAAISQVTGIDLPVVYFRLYLIPLFALLALQLLYLGRRMSGNVWVGVAAAALTLLVGELDLDPRESLPGAPFYGLFFSDLYQSPSFLLGLVLFLPAILLLGERLTAPTARADSGQWLMLALFAIGCAGAKVSIPPVLLGGLALFALWDWWTRRRLRPSVLLAAAVVAVVMAGFYVAQYRGHSSGTSVHLFGSTDGMIGISIIKSWLGGAPGPLGSGAILDPLGTVLGLVALLGAPLIGLPLLLRSRRGALTPGHAWLLALLLSGLAGFILIDPNGGFFLFYGYAAGVLLSAEGVVGLVSGQLRLGGSWVRLALAAAAWLAFLLVVVAVSALVWDPKGLTANGALYAVWFFVLALALALAWWTARRRAIPGLAAPVVVVLGVIVAGALDTPLDNSLRFRAGEKPLYERFFHRGMPGDLYAGLIWIRSHTGTDATLAVNRHLRSASPGSSAPRYFYYSAFSERRVFLEDWDFAARWAEVRPEQPFPERVDLNDAVFTHADPWAIRALADGAGVADLVVDRAADPVSPRLATRARLVYSNREVKVYSIARRTRTLVAREGGETIVGPSGEEIPVRPDAISGFVEQVKTEEGRVDVRGWSTTRDGPADRDLVFVDDRLVAAVRPETDRPDVAADFGPRAKRSGFHVLAPSEADNQHPSPSQVRVFAVRGGVASELKLVSH